MRVNSSKYKEWKKKRDRRVWIKKLLREKDYRANKTSTKLIRSINSNSRVFKIPVHFSIINNASEVTNTFKKIKDTIKSNKEIDDVFLNMNSVKKVTIDALMYLLTFIKNISISTGRIINLRGNLPKDNECRNIVVSSGFLKYLSSSVDTEYSSENVHITAGTTTDPLTIKNICDFVQEKFGCSRIETKILYNTLGEIIGNATEHAYSEGLRWKKWLTFARNYNGKIRVVILDTGFGILKTMTKKLRERISAFKNNADLLNSALKGEKRSATKLGYRNKGLPRIVNNVKKGFFHKMVLFTNDVCYEMVYNKVAATNLLDCSLEGTLYYLELNKENLINDN